MTFNVGTVTYILPSDLGTYIDLLEDICRKCAMNIIPLNKYYPTTTCIYLQPVIHYLGVQL